jgi:hypothetical protein
VGLAIVFDPYFPRAHFAKLWYCCPIGRRLPVQRLPQFLNFSRQCFESGFLLLLRLFGSLFPGLLLCKLFYRGHQVVNFVLGYCRSPRPTLISGPCTVEKLQINEYHLVLT